VKTLKKLLWLPVLLVPVVLVLALSVGCPGDYEVPPTLDSATGDGLWWPNPDGPTTKWDTNQQNPDYQWPDAPPSQPDSFQWSDSYSSASPFGCKTDSDCFGLKCCPTPWGVKLCAEVCQK
jgi:hypothetical protein